MPTLRIDTTIETHASGRRLVALMDETGQIAGFATPELAPRIVEAVDGLEGGKVMHAALTFLDAALAQAHAVVRRALKKSRGAI